MGFLYGPFPDSGSDADIDSKSYCKGSSDMTRGHLKNPFQFPQDAVMPDRMRNYVRSVFDFAAGAGNGGAGACFRKGGEIIHVIAEVHGLFLRNLQKPCLRSELRIPATWYRRRASGLWWTSLNQSVACRLLRSDRRCGRG